MLNSVPADVEFSQEYETSAGNSFEDVAVVCLLCRDCGNLCVDLLNFGTLQVFKPLTTAMLPFGCNILAFWRLFSGVSALGYPACALNAKVGRALQVAAAQCHTDSWLIKGTLATLMARNMSGVMLYMFF